MADLTLRLLVKQSCEFEKSVPTKLKNVMFISNFTSSVITSYLTHHALKVFDNVIIIIRYQDYNIFLSVKFLGFLGNQFLSLSMDLLLTQAKKIKSHFLDIKVLLFNAAIVVWKIMSTLEGSDTFLLANISPPSNNNYLREDWKG